MLNLKFADRIISDTGFESTHVLKVDQNRLQDFFSVDCTWFWRSDLKQIVDGARVSDQNQVIGLIGADPENPFSLAGEITVWIDGKKNNLTKSSLIFVPAGVPFGPLQIDHMEHPICYAATGMDPDPKVVRDPALPRYTILSKTKAKAVAPPTPVKRTAQITNIVRMEDDMAKGSFYVNINWQYGGYGEAPMGVHDHDWPELIAFAGSNPAKPYNIGGEMSLMLED